MMRGWVTQIDNMEIYRSIGNCLNEMRNVSPCIGILKKFDGKNSISCSDFTIPSFIHLIIALPSFFHSLLA